MKSESGFSLPMASHTSGKSSPVISCTSKPKRTFTTYQKRHLGFVHKNDQLIGDPHLYPWLPKSWEDSNDNEGMVDDLEYLPVKDN